MWTKQDILEAAVNLLRKNKRGGRKNGGGCFYKASEHTKQEDPTVTDAIGCAMRPFLENCELKPGINRADVLASGSSISGVCDNFGISMPDDIKRFASQMQSAHDRDEFTVSTGVNSEPVTADTPPGQYPSPIKVGLSLNALPHAAQCVIIEARFFALAQQHGLKYPHGDGTGSVVGRVYAPQG